MAKKKKTGAAKPQIGGLGAPRPSLTPAASPTQVTAPAAAYANPYVATAPPIDPMYEAYKVSSQRNQALSDADAVYQSSQIENTFGLGTDTSNPWSKAKLLSESFHRSQRGTENSYANRGQQYSGAAQVAKGENTRNYEMGYDHLARGYSDAKRNVAYGQLQSYANNVSGVDNAQFEALLRALRGS